MPLFRSLRPAQWSKNVFVLAPATFAGSLLDRGTLEASALAFVAFCAAASAVYLFNDLRDREQDRRHPRKRLRPVASGAVGTVPAAATGVALAAAALIAAWTLNRETALLVGLYLLANLLYSLWLKEIVIVDVMVLASGYVIRVVVGATAVGVTERLLDVLAVLLLLLSSVFVFTGQRSFVAAIVLVAAGAAVVVAYGPLTRRLLPLLARSRLARGRAALLIDIHQAFTKLVEPRMLVPGLALSTAAWAAEGIGCALVVRHYAPSVPVLASVFDYAASSVAGAASMIPGGLLAAEGSLVLLLERQGVALDAAMASTVIVRAATLWFAVAVGVLAMPWVLSLLRRPRQVVVEEDGQGVEPHVHQEGDVVQK